MYDFQIGDEVIYCGPTKRFQGLIGVIIDASLFSKLLSNPEYRIWVRWSNGEVLDPLKIRVRKVTKLDKALK